MNVEIEKHLSNIAHFTERHTMGLHYPTQRETIATQVLCALLSAETQTWNYSTKGLAVDSALKCADLLIEKLNEVKDESAI